MLQEGNLGFLDDHEGKCGTRREVWLKKKEVTQKGSLGLLDDPRGERKVTCWSQLEFEKKKLWLKKEFWKIGGWDKLGFAKKIVAQVVNLKIRLLSQIRVCKKILSLKNEFKNWVVEPK